MIASAPPCLRRGLRRDVRRPAAEVLRRCDDHRRCWRCRNPVFRKETVAWVFGRGGLGRDTDHVAGENGVEVLRSRIDRPGNRRDSRNLGLCRVDRNRFRHGLRLAPSPFGKLTQATADFCHRSVINGAFKLPTCELHLDDVDGLEEHIHHLTQQLQLAIAQFVQQRLKDVRGFGNLGETKSPAPALDRMRCTEDGVKVVFARGIDIKLEQQQLHFREQLGRLLEEDFVELGHVDSHGRPQIVNAPAATERCPAFASRLKWRFAFIRVNRSPWSPLPPAASGRKA